MTPKNLPNSSMLKSGLKSGLKIAGSVPQSYRYENKEYLLNTIMNQLGMTEEDLEQEPSWIKAKVRESNIDKVLEN
jgi:hypothetical protein